MTTNVELEQQLDDFAKKVNRALYGDNGEVGIVARVKRNEERLDEIVETFKELKKIFYGILASGVLLLLVEFINLVKQHPLP